MVHADQVVEIFPWAAVEKEADEVDTAFPGFVAPFVDICFDVGILTSLACDGESKGWK